MIIDAKRVLRGDRVALTPLKFDHIYKHFEWNNDPELNHLDSELPYHEESFGEFKKRFERMVFQPPAHSQDFEILADDTVIGVAYVVDISEHNRHCLIGITIGNRAYWGKGYGREAMDLVLDYCFNELGMHRVAAETFEYNMGWKRLVQGSGFQLEGTEREYLFRDEAYWDKEIYGMLEVEYRDIRQKK